MLRSKTFNKLSDLITFMRGQAIPVSAGTAIVQNSTGHYDLLYEDADAADDVVPNARPNAGVSYGEEDAVAVAGTVIEVSSFRTSVTGEALGAGSQSFSGTLANTYVVPGTVVISDGGGTAPAIADDRRGRLVERANPSVDRGSIDYSTGAFSVEYAYTKSPSGAMTVDYEYSALPTTSKGPNHARLSVLVISMSAGTTVDWAIYEDEAQTYPPIAQGSETLVGGSAQVSLGEIVSVTLTTDPAEMGKRWVSITPHPIPHL